MFAASYVAQQVLANPKTSSGRPRFTHRIKRATNHTVATRIHAPYLDALSGTPLEGSSHGTAAQAQATPQTRRGPLSLCSRSFGAPRAPLATGAPIILFCCCDGSRSVHETDSCPNNQAGLPSLIDFELLRAAETAPLAASLLSQPSPRELAAWSPPPTQNLRLELGSDGPDLRSTVGKAPARPAALGPFT